MAKEFKCLHCKNYKKIQGMHWCMKCNDEIVFKIKDLVGNGDLFIPKPCYFNNYFEESEEYLQQIKKEHTIPEYGLCCQVED